MRKVLVTCKQMQESLPELLKDVEKDLIFTTPKLEGQYFVARDLRALLEDHDYLIAGDDEINAGVIRDSALRFICKWGVGVDNIDLDAVRKAGIGFSNTPGMFGDDVADLALAYLLSLIRDIKKIDAAVRNGEWPRLRVPSLSQMSVVVLGFGTIGQAVSKRLLASGANVLAIDADPDKSIIAKNMGINFSNDWQIQKEVFQAAIICAPKNADTEGKIDADWVSRLAKGSYLVNVSRGGIVVESTLPDLIRSGHISGYASDVFEQEPVLEDNPLLEFYDSVWLGSHNASNASRSVLDASREALRLIFEYDEKYFNRAVESN